MSRVAVIDLGTNTFHILIAKIDKSSFEKVYHERIYTKLGQEGLHTIGQRSYQRGIQALDHFSQLIKKYDVDQTKVLGTSALRSASNGKQFILEVKDRFDIHIDVIDGEMEADYIYKGVRYGLPNLKETHLVMDIGGGSVEFIIADAKNILSVRSFQVGLSPLHHVADISNIARHEDVASLHHWLVKRLQPLYDDIAEYQPKVLIGSAGAFEVLVSMTGQQLERQDNFDIGYDTILDLYPKVLGSSREEKERMPGLPRERIDYISAAFVLIWHIIDAMHPEKICVSRFALKEGALSTFLD